MDPSTVFVSRRPTARASAWRSVHGAFLRGGGGVIGAALSCPSAALCVEVGGPFASVSSRPTGGAAAWRLPRSRPGVSTA
jgi:hypothetical protein